jgi:hypothetical protein
MGRDAHEFDKRTGGSRGDHQQLVKLIFQADRAWALCRTTGTHAAEINAGNFGDLFATLQDALIDQFTLSLTKLFEPASQPQDSFRPDAPSTRA